LYGLASDPYIYIIYITILLYNNTAPHEKNDFVEVFN